jgi:hypothetical protein
MVDHSYVVAYEVQGGRLVGFDVEYAGPLTFQVAPDELHLDLDVEPIDFDGGFVASNVNLARNAKFVG